ncbi:hypothetical protein JCM5296_002302 [Sporobolomyces johnsonii]
MKAKALEIRWHETKPIFSADFHASPPTQHKKAHHPYAKLGGVTHGKDGKANEDDKDKEREVEEREKCWRLATCGGDNNVRLWLVTPRPPAPVAPLTLGPSASSSSSAPRPPQHPDPKVEYLATLSQHTGVVNCVRFCPHGEVLASAGDDGNIVIWVPGESSKKIGESEEDRAYERESWRVRSMIRSLSGKEIYDIAWSPSGEQILAGSVDHTATIYDVASGQPLHRIAEHTNYVQGVAWDPRNQLIATQSSDRSMHVYSIASSSNGLQVHAVGRNSRMEVQRRPSSRSSSQTRAKSSSKETKAPSDTSSAPAASTSKDAEKDEDGFVPPRPRLHHRTLSRASDSDRSEASSTAPSSLLSMGPSAGPKPDEITTSMDPPSQIPSHHSRPPSHSRRSSTSGSQASQSPALIPQPSRPLRSPSPAPLPAIMVPLSPKLNPVASSSSGMPSFNETVRTDTVKLYGDANSTPFFRRLAWSTDGSLLLTPAGLFEDPYAAVTANGAAPSSSAQASTSKKAKKDEKSAATTTGASEPKPTVYIYSRSNVARPPIAHLPGHKTTSIAIRFCPVLWELRETGLDGGEEEEGDEPMNVELREEGVEVELPGSGKGKGKEKEKQKETEESTPTEKEDKPKPRSLFDLPYRMVYAVATLDSVYLYDTQQAGPVCMFGNLHYAPFTDLSWSVDGQTLIISSQDGYCSLVAFEPGELGTPYTGSAAHPPHHHSTSHAHLPHLPAPPASSNAGPSLPALLAKASASSSAPVASGSSPAKPAEMPAAVSSLAPPVVPEKKRAGEAPAGAGAEGGAPLAKKPKKKAALTFLGPLGS